MIKGLIIALLALALPAAAAENATPYMRDGMAAMRLVDAGKYENGTRLALVEVTLEGDAKTYWRTPGDSGIAPEFDFSASSNVAKTELFFPAPVRFADGASQSIGYHARVAFPVLVIPQDPAKPVRLHLNLNYAVCQQLCMPAKGEASLTLTGDAPTPAFVTAMAQVPVRTATPLMPKPVSATVMEVEVPVPPKAERIDLFAEGPDLNWALPLPVLVRREGEKAVFHLTLDGAPSGERFDGKRLTLTVVFDGKGSEMPLQLSP